MPGSIVQRQRMECRPMPNPERIIRLGTVLARTGLSRTTLYCQVGEARFHAKCRSALMAPEGTSLPSTGGSFKGLSG